MPREYCPICEKELHSIITRRVGDFAVCIDCGDTLGPLVKAIANGIMERAVEAHKYNIHDITAFAQMELADNFAALVPNPDELRKVL